MIKAMIIDDEKLIREGLVTYIDWESLGIEICRVCGDCAGGIRAAVEERPQLILADICLPDASGLEMFRQIKDCGLNCQVIFISSYSEFQYAQQAVKLGAFDYLLKPIEADVLYECVSRCAGKIRGANSEEETGYDAKAAEKVLYDVLTSGLQTDQTFFALVRRMGIPEGCHPFLEVAVGDQWEKECLEDPEENRGGRQVSISGDSGEQGFPILACCRARISRRVMCRCFFTMPDLEEKLEEVLLRESEESSLRAVVLWKGEVSPQSQSEVSPRSQTESGSQSRQEPSPGFRSEPAPGSRSEPSPGSRSESSPGARSEPSPGSRSELSSEFRPVRSLNACLQQTLCRLLLNQGAEELAAARPLFLPEKQALAPEVIRSLNQDELKTALFQFLEYCRKKQWTVNYLDFQFECFQFLETVYKQLTWVYGSPLPASLDMHTFIERLRTPNNLYDLFFVLWDVLETVFSEVQKDCCQSPYTRKALAIIRSRYGESLSLKSVAKELHVSPSYLSSVFKTDTGYAFSDYVFRHRMDIACSLVRQGNLRIYEIGEKVGYPDVAQFSKCFKKQFGYSPKQMQGADGGEERRRTGKIQKH